MRYLVLAIVLSLGLICGCREPQVPASEPEVVEVNLVPLSLPPVSTFESACARCHGPEGSFFGPGFANPEHADLAVIVREMMEGPAALSPSDADVEAMVAYHRALAADEPFFCVTAYEPATATTPGRLQGEATPQAVVFFYTVSAPYFRTNVNEQGYWEITPLPRGANLVLAADTYKNHKRTILNAAESQWSNALP